MQTTYKTDIRPAEWQRYDKSYYIVLYYNTRVIRVNRRFTLYAKSALDDYRPDWPWKSSASRCRLGRRVWTWWCPVPRVHRGRRRWAATAPAVQPAAAAMTASRRSSHHHRGRDSPVRWPPWYARRLHRCPTNRGGVDDLAGGGCVALRRVTVSCTSSSDAYTADSNETRRDGWPDGRSIGCGGGGGSDVDVGDLRVSYYYIIFSPRPTNVSVVHNVI